MEDSDINIANVEIIDLAYTYTKDNLNHIKSQIDNLRSRVATFLGFGGVLLRFILELSDSQPSYKITKILAFFTCFSAITLLGLASISNSKVDITSYTDATENNTDIFLYELPEQSKSKFIQLNKELSVDYFTTANKIKKLLNPAIICLVLSAFLFTVNGLLVSFFGK
ncbi:MULTISPECIES: hypothetical protein [unclassified Microcoleus]|uniref:hypothetical protein n=1 Tax=unclassified Microcoleus TaxID=2642155 RepID=UPI002FD1CE10